MDNSVNKNEENMNMGYDFKVHVVKSQIAQILSESKLPITTVDHILLELKLDCDNKLKYAIEVQKNEFDEKMKTKESQKD